MNERMEKHMADAKAAEKTYRPEPSRLDGLPNAHAGRTVSSMGAEIDALREAKAELLEFAKAIAEWNFNIQGDCVADAQNAAHKVIARHGGKP